MFFWSGKPENAEFEKELETLCESDELVLDIGCGRQKVHPRTLGVDAYEDYPTVNVKAYMWEMPFAENSVSGVICLSALEHVSKYKVLPTLQEFERVLKVGGRMIILVPDLEWVLKRFLDEPNVNYNMDMIFGDQSNEGQYHRTGFTEDIFALYFTEACKKSVIRKFFRVAAYSQENLAFICEKVKE
jgi:predicted SAM-dependent methyltransferase